MLNKLFSSPVEEKESLKKRSPLIVLLVFFLLISLFVYTYDVFLQIVDIFFHKKVSYDVGMKLLLSSFFQGKGLRLLVVICIVLFLFFFFRVRNYILAIIFYLIGNFLIFLGPYVISKILK